MDNKIIDELEAIYSQELSLLTGDLGALEQTVRTKMQQLGQGLLQRLVDRHANGYKGSSMACKCGNSMKFIQHRSKDIHTLFGWITIKRAYYSCPDCGESVFPYDDISGLGCEQVSPGEICVRQVDLLHSRANETRVFERRVFQRCVTEVGAHQLGFA